MTTNIFRIVMPSLATFLLLVAAGAGGVHAFPGTEQEFKSDVKLVDGGTDGKTDEAGHLAGIVLTLGPGWKTYWRMPGDSGIPPSFDWSGSQNLKSAEILYPAPHRKKDSSGETVVYDGEVVFPIRVTPEDKAKPTVLKLEFAYGLCKDICVPADTNLTLTLAPSSTNESVTADLVARYLAEVPLKKAKNEADMPTVKSVQAVLAGDNPKLVIEAAFPKGAEKQDLFVEAAGDFYIPMTRLMEETSSNLAKYKIDLSYVDEPSSLRGKTIICTLVSSKGNAEIPWKIE